MKEEKEDGSAVARENYSSRSAAAVLMMVFQFAKDNSAIHRQGRKKEAAICQMVHTEYLYRVKLTHHVVPSVPLTSNQKLPCQQNQAREQRHVSP